MPIAKQDFDRFMNILRVRLVGASDNGIKAELYGVIHEFLDGSSSWTEQITFVTQDSVREYTLTPTEGQIIRLAGVADANDLPVPAIMATPGIVTLRNAPTAGNTFTATVAKTVVLPTTRDAVPLAPDWLLPMYAPYIEDGVCSRMMKQSNKSYSDVRMSAYYESRFRDGMNKARVASMRRNTIGAQAWRFPQSYRTNTQRGGVSTGNSGRF